MWNRAGIKANAKESLKRFYWPAFLVCIIVGIFTGGGRVSGGYSGFSNGFNRNSSSAESIGGIDYSFLHNPAIIGVTISILLVIAIVVVIAIVIQLLVGNPLIVGKNRYFMCNRDEKTGIGAIGFAFESNFKNVVKTMFFVELFTTLWTLLFIIPGIIKSYEYAMIPYILSENPEMDSARVFELSKEMMMGQKWNYFVLQLSFIGWFLLGVLLCCIGGVFVQPYYEATLAEFYGWAREKMISTGFSNRYELKGFGEGTEL
ncbi:MAG: DUF975 family protein [Lachnotalea sp.]